MLSNQFILQLGLSISQPESLIVRVTSFYSGLLIFIYLAVDMSPFVSSILALLMIFSLAQSYRVELKAKIIFSISVWCFMSIVNFISIYIFYALESVDFSNFDPVSGQDQLAFTRLYY